MTDQTTTTTDAPDAPLMLMELTVELAAPPEVVWDAIATGAGMSAWFLQTDVEERVGGRVEFHMGPEMSSAGEITAWEPGERLVYSEPDWVALAGRENTGQQPLVSEFIIEATSGGTSVLRVVSSAYGTGAEWEREWFADMEANWTPSFDTLKRYVERFGGQKGARLDVDLSLPGDAASAWSRVLEALGSPAVGDAVPFPGTTATLERLHDEPNVRELLLRLDGPEHGFAVMGAYEIGDGAATVTLGGSLFGPDADAQVTSLEQRWRALLA